MENSDILVYFQPHYLANTSSDIFRSKLHQSSDGINLIKDKIKKVVHSLENETAEDFIPSKEGVDSFINFLFKHDLSFIIRSFMFSECMKTVSGNDLKDIIAINMKLNEIINYTNSINSVENPAYNFRTSNLNKETLQSALDYLNNELPYNSADLILNKTITIGSIFAKLFENDFDKTLSSSLLNIAKDVNGTGEKIEQFVQRVFEKIGKIEFGQYYPTDLDSQRAVNSLIFDSPDNGLYAKKNYVPSNLIETVTLSSIESFLDYKITNTAIPGVSKILTINLKEGFGNFLMETRSLTKKKELNKALISYIYNILATNLGYENITVNDIFIKYLKS